MYNTVLEINCKCVFEYVHPLGSKTIYESIITLSFLIEAEILENHTLLLR